MKKGWNAWLKIAGIVLLLFLLWLVVVLLLRISHNNSDEVIVKFLDIGQGDAILIETPSGRQVLVDAGPDKSILQNLAKELKFGDKEIDLVIASHPDTDHIGGLPYVFSQYQVKAYFDNGVVADNPAYQNIIKQLRTETVLYFNLLKGNQIILDQDLILTVLSPNSLMPNFDANTQSIILRLDYGSSSVLLTGDAPSEIENYLIQNNFNLEADILKVGHHGSKTSTLVEWVQKVAPEYAVISVGKNNYGHPATEVLDNLQVNKVKVLRTDELGTVVCRLKQAEFNCE